MTYPWCAYPVADCQKPEWRCKPQEKCGLCGRPVYRNTYTSGGHHHKGKETNESRESAR